MFPLMLVNKFVTVSFFRLISAKELNLLGITSKGLEDFSLPPYLRITLR